MAAADWWTVGYTVALIALAALAAGVVAVRVLAARSVATLMTVIAAVTVVATLAGVVVIALKMFISRGDLDVVLAVVLIAGIAGFGVSVIVGRRVSTASRLLLAAVREVGGGGRYRPPGQVLPAELEGLSRELERAQDRLAEARDRERALEASRRELVAWVSHDLRTPLAGLRAMAEALEDQVVTDQQTMRRYHSQIRGETDRLTLMIDDLFELSRIHAGALRLSRSRVGLDDLIGEVLASAEPLAKAKGVLLRGSAADGLPVYVDTAEVGRALCNLVINAIRHTPSDHSVEVVGDCESGMAMVSVSDSCGGIPADQLPRIFDVAFRGETARTPGPGEGAGLGLSIARGIVEAHAGQIAVRNAGPGCQFVIRLPLASAQTVADGQPGTHGGPADPRSWPPDQLFPPGAGLGQVARRRGGAGRLPERRPGELRYPGREPGLCPEAELAPGQLGRGHDVADVAEPVFAGDLGLRAAEGAGQGTGHLSDRVRLAAGDVIGAQPAALAGLQGRQVRRGDVGHVHEVPALRAVLEYLRRLPRFER